MADKGLPPETREEKENITFGRKSRLYREITELQFIYEGRKYKAQLEMTLASVVSDSKKVFLSVSTARSFLKETLG